MSGEPSNIKKLQQKIRDLETRLEESEQLIEAIKAGEVDAFAIQNRDHESQIYTLESGDYAYRILIEEFGEGAINVTEEGLIVYINPYFFELLELTYEKTIGTSIFDFIDPVCIEDFKALFAKSLSGQSKGEVCLKSNGKIIPVYISLTSLQPKLATVGIIITDFTEKKKNEQTILDYQHSLESKNTELIKTNTELASFAHVASHDLQEPLRKIQMFADRILEKEHNTLSENGKDHFHRMLVASKRMQILIEDLLMYSRMNSLIRNLESTDLNKIVNEVKEDLQDELDRKHAELKTDGMCEVRVIPFQIRQLLYNLISNSLKFSKPELPPVICISSEIAKGGDLNESYLVKEQKYCHISVQDNGIGFDPQYKEKIFELFQRLHTKKEYTGTGIGLAIVKKVVENHNGIIIAQSKLNQGTTFDIYIPA